jgi:hypothetical protein
MRHLFNFALVLNLLLFFSSCKEEESGNYAELSEVFTIFMAVTNNEGKDLAFPTNNYETTGDYPKRYRFDAWSAYLGDKLIQSNKEEGQAHFSSKKASYNAKANQLFIHLETDGWLQREMKDWYKKHKAKYVIVSQALFGDKKEHIIDLEILGIWDEVKSLFFVEFSVSVDGVKQEVYYPERSEGLYPKDPIGNMHYPYFVLNVDAL